MAQQVGDLWPAASGAASLGAEQISDAQGGFAQEIRPFNHMHMNSGVWHDPFGASGIIRFSNGRETSTLTTINGPSPGMEISHDGGRSFPLRLGASQNATLGFPNGISFVEAAEGRNLDLLGSGIRHVCNGNFLAEVTQNFTYQVGGNAVFEANSWNVASLTGPLSFEALKDDISLLAGTTAGLGLGGQILLFAFNGSGQLEYRFGPHQAWYSKSTHSSTGGPFNDGFWPLPHSGQILEMISRVSLQEAYDRGNEIDQTHRPAPSYLATASFFSQHDPVVVGHTDPGAGNTAGYEHLTALRDASIVASGFSLTPNLVNTFAFTAILPGNITMQGSGTPISHPPTLSLTCGNTAFPISVITASGILVVNASLGLIFNQDGTGDILFNNIGDGKGLGGQIRIEAFSGSGNLQYRLGGIGGHEAWHWKPSYAVGGGPNNDGYFPIPHSGQILNMISQNAGGTLQSAYEGNNNVFTTLAQGGPVNLIGIDTYGLGLYQQANGHPHILMSGIIPLVSTGLGRGAYWSQAHTAGMAVQLQGLSAPTTSAEASARSLGIQTLFMDTGSGIVNVRAGSGIAQFFNVSASAAITEVGLNVPINSNTNPDTWFAVSTASGIRPWVPGKYRITYAAIVEKTQGNLSQAAKTELRFFDKNGNQFRLLGSASAAIVRDSNALNLNSANGQWMGDLREAISLFLFVQATEAPPADNSMRAQARACNVIVEWIGPLSAGQSTIQQV